MFKADGLAFPVRVQILLRFHHFSSLDMVKSCDLSAHTVVIKDFSHELSAVERSNIVMPFGPIIAFEMAEGACRVVFARSECAAHAGKAIHGMVVAGKAMSAVMPPSCPNVLAPDGRSQCGKAVASAIETMLAEVSMLRAATGEPL